MIKTRRFSSVTPAILLALVICASTLSAAEWMEKVLYSFQAAQTTALLRLAELSSIQRATGYGCSAHPSF
jgi:urease accessory protein UreF